MGAPSNPIPLVKGSSEQFLFLHPEAKRLQLTWKHFPPGLINGNLWPSDDDNAKDSLVVFVYWQDCSDMDDDHYDDCDNDALGMEQAFSSFSLQ